MEPVKTTAELLIERKDQLFTSEIDEAKGKQRAIIAQCNNEIDYSKAQIAKQESRRQDAEDLLAELEERYPTPEPEVVA